MDFFMFDSPIGYMALAAEDEKLVRVYLPNAPTPRLMPRETPLLARARDQILEYLNGARKDFDLPLAPEGTAFQQKVWAALREIPFGQTRTYQDISAAVDCPRGAQAVGNALADNPLPLLLPCHRVICSDGSLGGYAGGEALKERLLRLEGFSKN